MPRWFKSLAAYTDPEYRGSTNEKYDLWRSKWPVVLPLYNIAECPQCGALCVAGNGVYRHRNSHFEEQKRIDSESQFAVQIVDAIGDICAKLGINYRFELDDSDNDDDSGNESDSDGYVL
jgi:hypothetical protein